MSPNGTLENRPTSPTSCPRACGNRVTPGGNGGYRCGMSSTDVSNGPGPLPASLELHATLPDSLRLHGRRLMRVSFWLGIAWLVLAWSLPAISILEGSAAPGGWNGQLIYWFAPMMLAVWMTSDNNGFDRLRETTRRHSQRVAVLHRIAFLSLAAEIFRVAQQVRNLIGIRQHPYPHPAPEPATRNSQIATLPIQRTGPPARTWASPSPVLPVLAA